MSKLNASDIQGFTLRGYNLPVARYLFVEFTTPEAGRALIQKLLLQITTGEHWEGGKPDSTLNIAFTHRGLAALDLPIATLLSFPVEFQQGMKARAAILGDTGANAPDKWEEIWQAGRVHAWLGINGKTTAALDACQAMVEEAITATGGATPLGAQDAAAVVINGRPTTGEHFGYTDGFGNPDFIGIERTSQPGQGKLTADGTWARLATGELLLGYADESGELPVAPVPHLLASNGTFMAYRKLRQNVAAFRGYLDAQSQHYAGGKEKFAAKLIGRWRDGTPLELSPDAPNPAIVANLGSNTNFKYGGDLSGARCPIGAHIRRVNPRDSFGFNGGLTNRRRITRRGLPYGEYVPEGQPVSDDDDRGIVFMALNACLSRQFEFVQQQWVQYANDSHLGNEKDPLIGNNDGKGRFMIQGDGTPTNPPFVCSHLPNFVQLRGGDYFFLPSITALGMIGMGLVDPR